MESANAHFRDLESRPEEAKRSGRGWMDVLPEFVAWEELELALTDPELAFPEETGLSNYVGSLTHKQLVEQIEARLTAEGKTYSDEEFEFWWRSAELADKRRLTFYGSNKEMPDDPFGVPVGKIDLFNDPR